MCKEKNVYNAKKISIQQQCATVEKVPLHNFMSVLKKHKNI